MLRVMKIQSLASLSLPALVALLCAPVAGSAQSILLSAGNFAVLGGTAISSSWLTGTDIISGNVGLSPGATSGITGFPPAVVTGGGAIIATGGTTGQARQDVIKAAVGLAGMPSNVNLSNIDLGGMTLAPGVYTFDGAATLNGALVLDAQGKNNAFWVFQIGTSLTTSVGSTVTVINTGTHGGSDDGIFWDAGTGITLGANNQLMGNYLAGTSITFGSTTGGEGRALALAGVSLDDNVVNSQGGPGGSDWTGGLTYDANGDVVSKISVTPVFTFQPIDQSVIAGANATFDVGVNGNATFQWQREAPGTAIYTNITNGSNFTGTNTTTLLVSNTTVGMSGSRFRVVATNDGVGNTSTSAQLTVSSPLPRITQNPVDATVKVATNIRFRVVATGQGPLTYAWERNRVKLKDGPRVLQSATPTLILRNVLFGDAGNYRVVVTNSLGTIASKSAMLTVTRTGRAPN